MVTFSVGEFSIVSSSIKSFFFWFEKDGALALKLEKVREEKGRERRTKEQWGDNALARAFSLLSL